MNEQSTDDRVPDDHKPDNKELFAQLSIDLFEANNHCFVVELRQEPSPYEPDQMVLRGRVTHVLSRRARYVQSLDEVEQFLRALLDETAAR